MGFRFVDPGVLIDGELELIAPSAEWVDSLMQACQHPQTQREAPAMTHVNRQQVLDFIREHPLGQQAEIVPSYHFWMRLRGPEVPVRIAGGISLRIGQDSDLELYTGHIGYHVYPPARGRHLAERACRLLLPLARRHGMRTIWITCNPDNVPSRRTCERLGAELVEIVPLPPDHVLYAAGEREKCRYRVETSCQPKVASCQ